MWVSCCLTSSPIFQVDPFHTLFGIAGLSLLGEQSVKPVNPVFCMPEETIRKAGIKTQIL